MNMCWKMIGLGSRAGMVAAVLTATLTSGCKDDGGAGTGGTGGYQQAGTGGESGGSGGTTTGTGGHDGMNGTGGTSGTGGTTTGTGGGGGAAACTAPSVAGNASMNADGVLTNYPQLRFTNLGGDIQITSAYFKLEVLTSFNSVQVWGDVRNSGTRQLCIPLVDTFNIGSQSLIVVVEGKAYLDSFSSVSDVCIEPGATAVYSGIQNQVSATVLSGASGVSYKMSGLTLTPAPTPHPLDPLVISEAPKQVSLGWALAGRMQAGSDGIYNLAVDVFIRDANGLLYDDTSAFPYDLADIPALTTFDFESGSVDSKFCAYERFESFIAGSMGLRAFQSSDDPALQRRGEHEQRLADRRAARDAARR